jgi:pilus assembly protein CpaB
MKTARIAVLGVAVAAGLGAAILAGGSKPPEKTAAPPPPPPAVTDDVLVAAKDLNFGAIVGEADLRWENWPKDHIPEGLVRKSASPSGDKELNGAIVRSNFAAGEPLRRERLVMGPHSGFLAAVLPSGSCAVAISIDAQGSSTAGGFILPNDRVDVIHIFHDEDAARKGINNSFVSQIIPMFAFSRSARIFRRKMGSASSPEPMQPWNSRRPKPKPSSWRSESASCR